MLGSLLARKDLFVDCMAWLILLIMLTLQRPGAEFNPCFLGGRQIEPAAEIKGSHRVVSSGGPIDSDLEVHPYSEALLSVVIMLVGTLGALHTDVVLDVLPERFFC
jgi:hypothetical protein